MKQLSMAAVVICVACSGQSGGGGGGGGGSGGGSGANGGGSSAGGGSAAGGGSGTGGGGGGGTSAGGGSAMGGGSGAGPVCMPGAPFGGGETTQLGGSVTADVVDQNGDPVASQPLYICGLNICSPPASTNAQGHASIASNLSMKKAAFKVGDAVTYAEVAIPVGAAPVQLGTLATGKFPTAGAAFTPGGDAVSGDVTVSLAAGANVDVNTLIYDTDDKQKLRTARIPINDGGVFAGSSVSDFALLYGASPAQTLFCPYAQVKVALPAGLGWTAGAGVEFWIMTTDTGQTYAPYAGWANVSDGVVSADGMSVTTNADAGFPTLENFAIRLK